MDNPPHSATIHLNDNSHLKLSKTHWKTVNVVQTLDMSSFICGFFSTHRGEKTDWTPTVFMEERLTCILLSHQPTREAPLPTALEMKWTSRVQELIHHLQAQLRPSRPHILTPQDSVSVSLWVLTESTRFSLSHQLKHEYLLIKYRFRMHHDESEWWYF